MKRNKQSSRTMRRRKTSAPTPNQGYGNSRYGRKVRSGRQMYGPGCCAHSRAPEWTAEERKQVRYLTKRREAIAAKAK